MAAEHEFRPFRHAPEVCDTCGELRDSHTIVPTPYSGHRAALWAVLIREGGDASTYGGYNDFETLSLRAHFGLADPAAVKAWNANTFTRKKIQVPERPCSVDLKRSEDPQDDAVSVFIDSFTDNGQEHAVVGYLACACGDYVYQRVALREKTLGQIIWMVVKEGDRQAA